MTRTVQRLTFPLLIAIFIAAGLLGGPANSLEPALMERLSAMRAEWPEVARGMAILTQFGSAPATLGVAAACSLWLLLRRAPAAAALLAVTVVCERLLVDWLKELIARPRPPLDLHLLPHSLAFPSGHSANSMTAFLASAILASPPGWRRSTAITAVVASIMIGLSRVYLGVHWPSDVIGGWAFGLLAVGLAVAIGRRSGALDLETKHQIVGGHRPAPSEDQAA